jgi:hypothetical protein
VIVADERHNLIGWRAASSTNAMELFEVPCRLNLWLYGSYGGQTSVRADADDGIAIEFLPEDRDSVIKALSDLVELMKAVRDGEPKL